MTRTRNEYPEKEHDVYEKTNKKKSFRELIMSVEKI